jgi:hypothetical protein
MVVYKSRYCPEICLGILRKTTKNLGTTGVSAEIRTEHFPKTSLEGNRYTNLLGYKLYTKHLNNKHSNVW